MRRAAKGAQIDDSGNAEKCRGGQRSANAKGAGDGHGAESARRSAKAEHEPNGDLSLRRERAGIERGEKRERDARHQR